MVAAVARIALGIAVVLGSPPGTPRLAMAGSATDAAAQDDRSDRADDQQDAIDAAADAAQARQAAGQAAPPTPREFNFRINAPLQYNSNPAQAPSGSRAALEADPAIELGWTRSLTSMPLKLSVRLRADTDRYTNAPQANEDEVSGSFKASYYDVNNDQAWAPFFSYKAGALFDATFSPWTETKNDLALGVDKLFNFDGDLQRLPASGRSRGAAVWSFGVSSFIQRRLRTPGPDSIALYVAPSATYAPTENWTVSLFVNARERWFDGISSPIAPVSRRDFEIEPISTIAYDPKLPGAPQVALQVGFERRASNVPDRSWSQWTAGPVLSANWRF
jgi:hypothetical protein